jgi:hypothetical protein
MPGQIILTSSQADQVRGVSMPGHGLHPRPLVDGNFGLPVEVLEDPAHAMHHAMLSSLPVREVAEQEWKQPPAEEL